MRKHGAGMRAPFTLPGKSRISGSGARRCFNPGDVANVQLQQTEDIGSSTRLDLDQSDRRVLRVNNQQGQKYIRPKMRQSSQGTGSAI